jgi:cell division protein FtsB
MAKDHTRRAERYINHMQRGMKRDRPQTRLTVLASSIMQLFQYGLPKGWGK